jgi:hypothetical protein
VVEFVDIVLVDREHIEVASSFEDDFAIVVVVVVVAVVACDNFVEDDTFVWNDPPFFSLYKYIDVKCTEKKKKK